MVRIVFVLILPRRLSESSSVSTNAHGGDLPSTPCGVSSVSNAPGKRLQCSLADINDSVIVPIVSHHFAMLVKSAEIQMPSF